MPTLEAKLAVRLLQMGPFCTFWANGGDFNTAFDWTGLSPGWAILNPALAETLKCRAECPACARLCGCQ